jgi:N-acetylmuramic acid 6-phosphate etherase
VRLGRTYSNLMTDMVPSNGKLRDRQLRMMVAATGAGADQCRQALTNADGDARVAVVALISGIGVPGARHALDAAGGHVHAALSRLNGHDHHSGPHD